MRMIFGKAVIVALTMVGAASCASNSGGIKPSTAPPASGAAAVTPAAAAKVRMTRIVVSGASLDCTATIDDYNIVGKPNKKVAWMVEDASTGCSSGENWHIELEFTTDWNNGADRIVKIKRDDIKAIKVHPNTPPTTGGPHKYKVFLVYPRSGNDVRIEVIDPELDIEM